MSGENEHISELYQKFLDGQCTPEELQELLEHFERHGTDSPLLSLIREQLETPRIHTQDIRQRAEKIVAETDKWIYQKLPTERKKDRAWIGYAALAIAAALCIICATYVLYRFSGKTEDSTALVSRFGGDAAPGTNKATLTFSNGRSYQLSDKQSGIMVGKNGITYEDGSTVVGDVSAEMATITTPRGGQYALTLPDGSKVWLNAESSLKYPLRFAAGERRVELHGEGYFSVQHNPSWPFYVKNDAQEVKVLGTEFNVRTYATEPILTTLVNGHVQVTFPTAESHAIQLTPGEQLTLLNGKTAVRKVNTDSYTGWKEGMFIFHDLPLSEVLPQLEKWYDIKLPAGPIPSVPVYGEVNRNTKLSDILELLEAGTGVHFEVKERRLLIKK